MQARSEFDRFLDSIRPHILDYLKSKGYNTSTSIRCINPTHDDHHPSMFCARAGQNDWRVFCSSCLRETELIWTEHGLKRLKDVSVGDLVLTHKGQWKPVLARKDQTKETISIATGATRDSIRLTPDHTCLYLKKEDMEKAFSYIWYSRPRGKLLFMGRARKRKPIGRYASVPAITSGPASELRPGDFLLFPVVSPSEEPYTSLPPNPAILSSRSKRTNRLDSLPLDKDSGYFYGLYLAEGNCTDRTACLTFHINEEETLCQKGLEWAEKVGLRAGKTSNIANNRCNLVISSTDLAELLKYWFGTGAKQKRIPAEFLNMPKEFLREVLTGYFDGDGGPDRSAKTVSEELALGIFTIAVQLNERPSLLYYPAYQGADGQSHSEYWTVRLRKQESLDGFYEEIDGVKYYISQITKIDTDLHSENVVDISVLGDESFICKVGAVHNCGFRGDIFDVYSILEDTPRKGPEWVKKTVLPLAALFGVEAPELTLSFDEGFRQELYRVYEAVASLLEHNPGKMPPAPQSYVQKKEWTHETLSYLDIGTLNSEKLCSCIPREEREKFGLQRADLFSDQNLVFTIRDKWGRPIRFFARRPDGEKPKFCSTNTRDLAVDVWSDSGHLYLAHLITSSSTRAILVEGQPDAVSLWQAGFPNVIAPCGSNSFSEHHSDSLGIMGISEIILLYDGDKAGEESVSNIISKDFTREGGISYEVSLLPTGYDPDDYLREKGKDALSLLLTDLRMSSFEYLISRQDPSNRDESICQALIPYITAAKSEIAREKMARDLSSFLEKRVSISAILADVHRSDKETRNETLAEQGAVVISASRQAQNNIPQAKQIFREALDRLEEVERQKSPNASLTRGCLSRIRACKTYEESGLCGGFDLLPGHLQSLADALAGGDWRSGRLLIIGGIQNMGKSSFVDALTWEIVSNPDNNAIAYVQTLDDPAEIRFRRFMCNAIGDVTLTQNMIASPSRYAEELGIEDLFEKRERAYARLTEVVASGRLIIEDSSDGRTIAHADRRLRQIRRENPDANIIHIVDNLHNCDDWGGTEAKDRVSRIVKYERTLCDLYKVTSICTAEYRKGDPSIPGNDEDLADTRALKFEPHLTLHLFSDIVAKGADEAVWVHHHNGHTLPRVVVTIGKNKITDTKGSLVFDFFPAAALFLSVPKARAMKEKKEREEELAIQAHGIGNA